MDLREPIARQTDFSLNLTRHVVSKAKDAGTNLAFSPLSLHAVLSLVATGAKGQTLHQLTSFLRASSDGGAEELAALAPQIVALVLADGSAAGGPKIAFANGVWVEKTLKLKEAFSKLAAEGYKAQTKSVDFQTNAAEVAAEVNSWVDKETDGLVKELLPAGSVDGSTRLVLGNALYFKGIWEEKFNASETKNHEFHLLDGNSIQVPFMTGQSKQFLGSFEGFKVLRLLYKQGEDKRQYSMYMFLPDSNDGLWGLAEKLGSKSGFLDRYVPLQKVSVGDFKIPKFRVSFGLEASALFKDLGLDMPFGGEGDLTEIVDSPVGQNFYISGIFHKAFVEVNEEGTEAAAASAAVVKLRALPSRPIDFVADHPFLFIIREDMTGVVVFSGHVLNPLLIG